MERLRKEKVIEGWIKGGMKRRRGDGKNKEKKGRER